MMNFIWPSRRLAAYQSVGWHDSRTIPHTRFSVRKVSLENRLELIKQIRELCLRHEFLRAGDTSEQSEAAVADLTMKKLYLEWGLIAIRGLTIDGKAATVESLITKGPEGLADEIIEQIRHELGLTEQERKNF